MPTGSIASETQVSMRLFLKGVGLTAQVVTFVVAVVTVVAYR
jgi:hypothetical protein